MKKTIAVLLCFAMLLPMFGCTEREPDLFMDVKEIAEKYPGVELKKGNDAAPVFNVDLGRMESLEWVRHLTRATTLRIQIEKGKAETLVLPNLSHCKSLKTLIISSHYDFKEPRWELNELDLSTVSDSAVTYLRIDGPNDMNVKLGDGVETIVFRGTVPDMDALATMPNLKEIQLLSDEPYDIAPLASSESLHLLQLGICSNNWEYEEPLDSEWNLSPMKGSNIDTLLLGVNLSAKLLKSLEGAENIHHLQINHDGLPETIDVISSLPNLETVAIFGFSDSLRNSDRMFMSSKADKDTIEEIAGLYGDNVASALQRLVDRGGTVVWWNINNWNDNVAYGIEGGAWAPMTDKYYDWYYKNVK